MPTILIADDSLSVRKVAERLLTEAGLEVALAANGEEAMTWMSTKRPDLVIADVIMPDKSGFEVCAYVRAHANLADTPVLLVSGFVDDEVTRQAEACRANGVIKKPFQGAMLKERVMELLSARKVEAAPAPAPELVLEMPAATPELVLEMPAAVPEPVAAAAPATEIEMPVIAPEPVMPVAAVATPVPAPAPSQGVAALFGRESVRSQVDDQVRALQDRIQGLEAKLAEQEKSLMHVKALEARLAEEERQSAQMQKRIAELEPAAAAAEKLVQTLMDFARHVLSLGKDRTP